MVNACTLTAFLQAYLTNIFAILSTVHLVIIQQAPKRLFASRLSIVKVTPLRNF